MQTSLAYAPQVEYVCEVDAARRAARYFHLPDGGGLFSARPALDVARELTGRRAARRAPRTLPRPAARCAARPVGR